MCGLCGTFSPDGSLNREVAAAMHSRLVHRGPDETYSFSTPVLSMKLGRLGMTALKDGWQPAEDRTGRFVAMTNGEVFNYRAIMEYLGDSRPDNKVDVAVVPELFARYGVAGLELIDGQFATAIYDRAESCLYLGRDRFGICPMYYTVLGGHTHFCSELKPLVSCVPHSWRLDMRAVDQYLCLGNIVAPRTLVRDVQAVPPGCVVRFGEGTPQTIRYWRYGEFTGQDSPVAAEEIRATLQDAVRDRLPGSWRSRRRPSPCSSTTRRWTRDGSSARWPRRWAASTTRSTALPPTSPRGSRRWCATAATRSARPTTWRR
jgi:asparagine synthase (glutamine-hydrolysing)